MAASNERARGAWHRLKPLLGMGLVRTPIEGYRLPAPVPDDAEPERILRLHAVHLDEELDVVPFDEEGRVRRFAFARISELFRCRHSGERVPIDPRLIRLLLDLSNQFEGKRILVVSGHRAAGVLDTSPTSRHVGGQAADVRIAGVGLRRLRQAALDLGAGGVGFYPHDHFVHVDVREEHYVWTQGRQRTGKGDDAKEEGSGHDSSAEPERDGAHSAAAGLPAARPPAGDAPAPKGSVDDLG